MSSKQTAKTVKASKTDLAEILNWLEIEHDQPDASPFWKNRDWIRRALTWRKLWVIRIDGQAAAFQVGNYSPEIVNVKREFQRRGLGTALFTASLKRAQRDNVNVLSGECEPPSSLPFWLKHGFERYGEADTPGPIRVRLIIPRDHLLPVEQQRAEVIIEFHSERALYDVLPHPVLARHELSGSRAGEGTIQLARRVIGSTVGLNLHGDLAVRITIDGVQRVFCKAKHEAAKQAGFVRDREGTFYIDVVNL